MPGHYDPRVLCPFYRFTNTQYYKSRNIRCEGMDYSFDVSLLFTTRTAQKDWLESYCCNPDGWWRCPYAKIASRRCNRE